MIRQNEETVMNFLKEVTVRDQNGKEHQFPIIYANKDKLEAFAFSKNANENQKTNQIKLPVLAFCAKVITRNRIIFRGNLWTLYRQDMNSIIEKLFHLEDKCQANVNGEPKIAFGTFRIGDEAEKGELKVLQASFDFSITN